MRKQTQDVQNVLSSEEGKKKAFALEKKILRNIIEMARNPEDNIKDKDGDEEED